MHLQPSCATRFLRLATRSTSTCSRIADLRQQTGYTIRSEQRRWRSSVDSASGDSTNTIKGKNLTGHERYAHELNDEEVIIVDSLEETLLAHRRANADALKIIKVFSVNTKPVEDPSTAKHVRGQEAVDFRTLMLNRTTPQEDDYAAEVYDLNFEWAVNDEVPRYSRLPWMKSMDKSAEIPSESALERLQNEILAADNFLTPSPEEAAAAAQIKNSVEAIVTKTWDVKKLDTIGSRATGFAGPLSDLDLNVVLRSVPSAFNRPRTKDPAVQILHTLYHQLRDVAPSPDLQTNFLAVAAKVPVISLKHVPSELDIQIQCSDTSYGNLELQKALAAELPHLRPIFRVIKHLLKMRGLSGIKLRGLTSYPLIIMIATALRTGGLDGKDTDAATQLLHVLEFWATFDTYQHGITHIPSPRFGLEPSSIFKSKEIARTCIDFVMQDPIGAVPVPFSCRRRIPLLHNAVSPAQANYRLTLHDPADPYNDLGFGNKYIKHIQATFGDIHAKLKKGMSDWDHQLRAGRLTDRLPALLAPILEGDYTLYNLNRKKLLALYKADADIHEQRSVDTPSADVSKHSFRIRFKPPMVDGGREHSFRIRFK